MAYRVLGIETSCDETAAAVYDCDEGIKSSVLFSQIDMQKDYGGVIPELASRTHLEKINGIVELALQKANTTLDEIDAIAVTNTPGLPGSLLIGLSFAKGIAFAKSKKLIGVNHLEAHAFSPFIENQDIPFPHVCLTASGGHTNLYMINDFGNYIVLGQTLDDAAGEAFDKIAKLINLPYPGGPVIEKLAREVDFEDFYHYPRGKEKTIDFSFSGLKTAVMYDLVKKGLYDMQAKKFLAPDDKAIQQKVASSLLVCVKDILINKLLYVLELNPDIKAISFAGGVACNTYIKKHLQDFCDKKGLQFYYPSPQYCTDNAAMIAFVGCYKAQRGQFSDFSLDIFE